MNVDHRSLSQLTASFKFGGIEAYSTMWLHLHCCDLFV